MGYFCTKQNKKKIEKLKKSFMGSTAKEMNGEGKLSQNVYKKKLSNIACTREMWAYI